MVYAPDPACWNNSKPDSCVYSLPVEQRVQFLGAEAAQWGEFTDEFNIDQKTWFRLPAIHERMWTTNESLLARGVNITGTGGKVTADYHNRDIVSRLIKHRCRLLQRGVQAMSYSSPASFRSKWMQCQGWLPTTPKSPTAATMMQEGV